MSLGNGVSFDVSSLVADRRRQCRVPTGLLTLASVDSLGEVLQDQRQSKEAEELYRQALAGRRKMLGEDDPDTLASVNDLGRVLHDCDGTWELEQQASDGGNDAPKALQWLLSQGHCGLLLYQATNHPRSLTESLRDKILENAAINFHHVTGAGLVPSQAQV